MPSSRMPSSWFHVDERAAESCELEARGDAQQRFGRADAQEAGRRHALGERVDDAAARSLVEK